MKKILLPLLLLVTLLYPGCEASPLAEPSGSDEPLFREEAAPPLLFAEPEDLGVPLAPRYANDPAQRIAMTPRDLILFRGNLYVGSGDWGGNLGPVEMYCYDTSQKRWIHSETLPDEEVNAFSVIENTLFTPGIDPRDDWSWGNLYFLEDGVWQTKRTIPGGIHCFDLAYLDGLLFAAVKTEGEALQVALSPDLGETFTLLPLRKNGAPVTDVRFYFDLLTIGENVYAICDKELYRYNGTAFAYETSWEDTVKRKQYNAPKRMNLFLAKAIVGETTYFTTGIFYACSSPNHLREIELPENAVAYDLYVYENNLYVLCNLLTEEGYTVTVYRYLSEGDEFIRETAFKSAIPAISFACDDTAFYFSLASNNTKHTDHGRILKIEK